MVSERGPRLGFWIGFWVGRMQRMIMGTFAEILREWCEARSKPYVLTPPQWGVLSLLDEDDGLPIGVIGQRRAVDAPTVTDVVARMERTGLVARVHDDVDRRVVRVFLTDEGRAVMAELPATVSAFYARLTHNVSLEEIEQLYRVVAKLSATMQEMAPMKEAPFDPLPPWNELD
jgi:DNA-binding MarR family transcriptional regulator